MVLQACVCQCEIPIYISNLHNQDCEINHIYICWDLIGLTGKIWTNKNAADNKIASLSYKPYACFRRDIKDLSYIIIRYKEVYLWLLSMIHVPLVCKLTGTTCMQLPSTFTHTQAETIPVRDASTLDNLCRKYEQQRLGLRSRIIRKENVFFRIIQIQNLNKTCVKMLTQKPTIGGDPTSETLEKIPQRLWIQTRVHHGGNPQRRDDDEVAPAVG